MTTTQTAPLFVGRHPVGSPAWHAARRETINGSEIAAVMGISPYESAFSLWHRKMGSLAEIETLPEMYWGTRLEDVILDEFRLRHDDLNVEDGGGLWRHPERTWQGGSPDGRAWTAEDHQRFPDALVEIKTARYGDSWGIPGTDEIPVHYRAQVLWYLDVFGLDVCHVAVLIAGSDYREYRVEYAADEVRAMREAARDFLDSIDTGTQPPIDGHEATYEAVKELHPDIEPGAVEIPADTALPYLRALAGYSDAVAEKRRRSAEVVAAMGNAQTATYLKTQIASRQAKAAEGSTPYLVAARGVADQFRKDTTT